MGDGATVGGDRPPTGRRLTVWEASEALGITVEAVRGRIKRGTIGYEREGDRVYVLLDADRSASRPDQDDDRPNDRSELVALLRDQLEDLRSDRDAWREQARRSDYLLGSAMERTRELEGRLRELGAPQDAPPAPRESPEGAEAGGDKGDVPPQPQAATSRPWWRRVFGG